MKTINFLLLQFCLLFFALIAPAQTAKPVSVQSSADQSAKTVKSPEVREELLRRLKASRELRMELVKNNSATGVSQLVKSD